MLRPADEQRVIDEEVARSAELLRQWEERERRHAAQLRRDEEHARREAENQRLRAELRREAAEHQRQLWGTSAAAELLDLRKRVAALEQTLAEVSRARHGAAQGGPSHLAPGADPPSD